MHEAEKRGPALKNRLVGDAEMYKRLLDREPLKAADGAKNFRDTLRPHFTKRSSECVLHPSKKRKHGDDQVNRQVFIALETLKGCLDMFPLSTMSEERRENQCLADVIQENAERQRRSAEVLDPNAQESRDRWNATQVSNREKPFPFSDNLTTLMFFVVSDLSEAQRERLTSSLSPQGMNVAAYTFEALRTVFVELFCTPKSSDGESFTARERTRHRGRLCCRQLFGQWATDEVTGEQGCIDDESSCFWTWDDTECVWQSRPFKGPPGEEKRRKR